MKAIWQSLAWKEWHEHKWKLVSITAVLWGVAALTLGVNETRDKFDALVPLTSMCLIPLAVFVGLGSAAGERSRGTFAFTQSLPVPMWRVAMWKLLMGFATLSTPVVLSMVVLYIATFIPALSTELQQAVNRANEQAVTGSVFADIGIFCTAFACSFYIWATAFGVNRKDEVSAGAVAISAMVGWCMLVFVLWYLICKSLEVNGTPITGETSLVIGSMIISTAPGGFVMASDTRVVGYAVVAASIATVTHSLLLAVYLSRFGRIAGLEVVSPKVAHECDPGAWLNGPRKSAFCAIAWKQFRESLPLVVVGFAGVVACAAASLVADGSYFVAHPDSIARMFTGISMVMGFIVAVVIGIGVCLNDVSPSINTFWRSRPINSDVWFWTKFGTGLGILLAAVYVPVLVVIFVFHPDPLAFILEPDSLVMPVAQIAVFAAAVMTTSLVRQAVYAAILSMAAVYIGVLIGLGLWYLAGLVGWVHLARRGWMEPEDNIPVAVGMLLSFVASTIVAWLAVRNDWGRKSRY